MENENITVAEVPSEFQQQPIQNQFDAPPQVEEVAEPTLSDLIAAGDLTKIPINNENVSLNVIVAFLNQASRRGAFSIEENAKIWECIKLFVQPSN